MSGIISVVDVCLWGMSFGCGDGCVAGRGGIGCVGLCGCGMFVV